MKVGLTTDPLTGDILIEASYRDFEPIREQFKTTIPGRRWTGKHWAVSALYAEELLAFLQQVQATVKDERADPTDEAQLLAMPEDLREAFKVLTLAPDAPLGVAQAVYKFYATKFHPDKGGDPEQFRRVSAAMATIKTFLEDPHDDLPF